MQFSCTLTTTGPIRRGRQETSGLVESQGFGESNMPKYLLQANYTSSGMQGLLNEGGTSRRQVFADLAREQGGALESFYYAFGGADLYMVFDLPDATTAAAVSLVITAGGALSISTVQLITPEEIDAAVNKTVNYRPPGA